MSLSKDYNDIKCVFYVIYFLEMCFCVRVFLNYFSSVTLFVLENVQVFHTVPYEKKREEEP